MKELREEFERESEKTGKPRLLLTMAVPAGIEYIEKGFDVKTLNRYVPTNFLSPDYKKFLTAVISVTILI